MKKVTVKLGQSYIIFITILILIVAVLVFSLKFSKLSFQDSKPSDWNSFITYINGILIPFLTFINIVIFIRLTKSVQRASENKSWVERTEKLTFDLIDSISKEASFITMFTVEMTKLDITNQSKYLSENKINEKIRILNNEVSEKQFKLRLFVESEMFNTCETRDIFLNSTQLLIPRINEFLNVFKLSKL